METLEWLKTNWAVKDATPYEIPNKNREDLADLFGKLGFKTGAEIGVEQGVYSEVLCRYNPGLKLYCVDAWTAYGGYREHVSQEKLDGFMEITRKRLKDFNVELIKGWSVEAADRFEDKSLDFVYLDANHDFTNVVRDLDAWARKVRKGGIVAGHDYRFVSNMMTKYGVIPAVNGWTQAYQIKPWFLLGSKVKQPGEKRDNSRSWFYVR